MEEEQYGGGDGVVPTNAPNWTLLHTEQRDAYLTGPVFFCFGGLAVLIFGAISCGIARLCRKDESDRNLGYSVAVTNSLFREGTDTSNDLPCLNCRLIEMGEMACYQDRCPQCGKVPPGRKAESVKRSRWSMRSSRSQPNNGDSKV